MASEKNLNLKKDLVKKITNQVEKSEAVIIFTYQGLTVSNMVNLRRKLREVNAEVKIYKNTLVKIALEDLKLDLNEFLAGPNAILFGENLLEAIKVLDSFAKENKTVEIKAGIIKGDIVSLETIKEYATIPSMEGLLTMLAGGMIEHVKNLSISLNLYAEGLEENN
ncbi:MAG: 50S ribosomal protein L10 [Bacilli bacterium]|nr:50S ribosomal protein L10 [Bacilli bacterium]